VFIIDEDKPPSAREKVEENNPLLEKIADMLEETQDPEKRALLLELFKT